MSKSFVPWWCCGGGAPDCPVSLLLCRTTWTGQDFSGEEASWTAADPESASEQATRQEGKAQWTSTTDKEADAIEAKEEGR